MLFILGWSSSLLLTANLPGVERLGQALFEGQLYFASPEALGGAAAAFVAATAFLRWQGKRLLLANLNPEHFHARKLPARPIRIGTDMLASAVLALAVTSLGVMGAFALVFIPAWRVFALAPSWRAARIAAPLAALFAYLLAFVIALFFDQAFGPVLALVLGLLTLCTIKTDRKMRVDECVISTCSKAEPAPPGPEDPARRDRCRTRDDTGETTAS